MIYFLITEIQSVKTVFFQCITKASHLRLIIHPIKINVLTL